MQADLFSGDQNPQAITVGGLGDIVLIKRWLPGRQADQYFDALAQSLHWEQPEIMIAGSLRKIPRQQAWYGEERAVMSYSGKTFYPRPWPSLVKQLKADIEKTFYQQHLLPLPIVGADANDGLLGEVSASKAANYFNSALVNLYRDGRDSVSWHADDEPELGPAPVIASLSLGGARRFSFKPRVSFLVGGRQSSPPVHITLESGDLLLMRGNTQSTLVHCVPKQAGVIDARINLTFRRIIQHRVI